MDIFIQQIINGLVLGSVYALVALGYTMVYGIINLINFAHGEVMMVGALTSWTVSRRSRTAGMPGWLMLLITLVAAMAVCAALNFSIEKVAYRPLRKCAPPGAADHRDGREPDAADACDDHLEAEPEALPASCCRPSRSTSAAPSSTPRRS
jgi:hypothetical protein